MVYLIGITEHNVRFKLNGENHARESYPDKE